MESLIKEDHCVSITFSEDKCFRAVLCLQHWEEGTEISHLPSAPSPVINIGHQSGTVWPSLNLHWHHNHPKTVVYVRVHSWCCSFCGFGKMYNDTVHHDSVTWSIFMTLTALRAPPMRLSLPTPETSNLVLSLQLCPFQDVTELESHSM